MTAHQLKNETRQYIMDQMRNLITIKNNVLKSRHCPEYLIAKGKDFRISAPGKAQQKLFLEQWEYLPKDPYLPREFGSRYRRHGCYVYVAKNKTIASLKPEKYFQSKSDNPVAGGMHRKFAPLESDAPGHPFLIQLLHQNIKALDLDLGRNWKINVHLIRIPASLDTPGVPCPEGIHKDGFDAISIHLMNRQKVSGGKSTLYSLEGKLLQSIELGSVLDTIYSNDRKVMHFTSEFFASGTSLGYRDTLLTSFNVME